MFKISYILNKTTYSNLADVDDMFLRYDFLEGNAKLSSDIGLITLHEGIPLLDLAVALRLISIELNNKRNDKQSFDYTESGDEVIFTKDDDKLTITTTYSQETIEINYKEFTNAVEVFYSELIKTISVEYPGLSTNKSYQKILSLTENISGNEKIKN